jgi:hypothetical protein
VWSALSRHDVLEAPFEIRHLYIDMTIERHQQFCVVWYDPSIINVMAVQNRLKSPTPAVQRIPTCCTLVLDHCANTHTH